MSVDGRLPDEVIDGFCSGVTVVRPADAFNQEVERDLWPNLYKDRSDKRLTAALNTIFELDAEGFSFDGQQFIVLSKERGLPLALQGDGTRCQREP